MKPDDCSSDVIANVFYEIAPVDCNTVKVKGEIQKIMKRAISELRWLTYADALLCVGGSSLFNREKSNGAISGGTQSP